MGRTMVKNARPRRRIIAASACCSSAASAAREALNTTLPLERTVFTSVKPAASKAARSSAILAFMGITPRSRAA